jgi:hypothetical protein
MRHFQGEQARYLLQLRTPGFELPFPLLDRLVELTLLCAQATGLFLKRLYPAPRGDPLASG